MQNGSPIRRLTLVPTGGDEAVRRYRLARLDEIALATPPYETDPRRPGSANGTEPEDPAAEEAPPDLR